MTGLLTQHIRSGPNFTCTLLWLFVSWLYVLSTPPFHYLFGHQPMPSSSGTSASMSPRLSSQAVSFSPLLPPYGCPFWSPGTDSHVACTSPLFFSLLSATFRESRGYMGPAAAPEFLSELLQTLTGRPGLSYASPNHMQQLHYTESTIICNP